MSKFNCINNFRSDTANVSSLGNQNANAINKKPGLIKKSSSFKKRRFIRDENNGAKTDRSDNVDLTEVLRNLQNIHKDNLKFHLPNPKARPSINIPTALSRKT